MRDGATFPNNSLQGFTGTGTTTIFDFRVSNLDQFHQSSFFGNVNNGTNTNRNGAFPNGTNCFSQLDGTNVLIQPNTGDTYLMHAVEISFDELGDDDTLCEANENCMYTPNRGAFQGEGDVYSQQCIFSNGGAGLSGIEIYARPNEFGI